MVTAIEDSGYLRVIPLGGWDARTLVSQRVVVHGREVLDGHGRRPAGPRPERRGPHPRAQARGSARRSRAWPPSGYARWCARATWSRARAASPRWANWSAARRWMIGSACSCCWRRCGPPRASPVARARHGDRPGRGRATRRPRRGDPPGSRRSASRSIPARRPTGPGQSAGGGTKLGKGAAIRIMDASAIGVPPTGGVSRGTGDRARDPPPIPRLGQGWHRHPVAAARGGGVRSPDAYRSRPATATRRSRSAIPTTFGRPSIWSSRWSNRPTASRRRLAGGRHAALDGAVRR